VYPRGLLTHQEAIGLAVVRSVETYDSMPLQS